MQVVVDVPPASVGEGPLWNISNRVRVGNLLRTGSGYRLRSRSSSGGPRSIGAGLIVAHEPDAYPATGLHPKKRNGENQEGRRPTRKAAEDYHVHTKRLSRLTSAAVKPIWCSPDKCQFQPNGWRAGKLSDQRHG